MRAWTERGHGVAMETASVGAYAIGVTWTQKPTPVLPSLRSATVLGWYGTPGGCAGMQQRSLTDLTHKTTHIVPRGSRSSIWSRTASGPYLASFFFLSLPSNTSVEGFLSVAIKKMIKRSKKSSEQNKSTAREQGGN